MRQGVPAALLTLVLLSTPGLAQEQASFRHGEPRAAESVLTCFSRDFAVEMAVALNRHLRSGGRIEDLSGSKGGETAGEMMLEGRCFRARDIDHTPMQTVYRDDKPTDDDHRLYSVVASEVRLKGEAVVIHILTTADVPPPPKKKKPKFK
jgi:hypothetical protein